MRSSNVQRRRPPDRRVRRQPCSRCDPLMHAVGRAGRAQSGISAGGETDSHWTGEESTGMTWVGEIAIVQQMNNPIPTNHMCDSCRHQHKVTSFNQNGIDSISINETRLDDTMNDFELLIPGFVLYRRDKHRHGGDVAFYIKESITQKLRADISMPGLESIWVEVNAPGGISYLLCSMYHPSLASHDYYDKIVENIELTSIPNKEIVIFGDLNFNYMIDESLSSNPIHLIETLFQMSQMISKPMRRTLTRSTLLVVILTSIPEKHSESRVLKTAFSDHYSLFTVIGVTKSLSNNGGHKLIKFRDYNFFSKWVLKWYCG